MIGERLLDLRKDAGLTQDELAEVLHINKHSISAYERGRSEPPDQIKIAIARYFHVSTDYLLGLTDRPDPTDEDVQCLRLPAPLTDKEAHDVRRYVKFVLYSRDC